MDENNLMIFTKELIFKESGETIKISLEYKNVSPEKIKMTQNFIDVMWDGLKKNAINR